MTDTTRRELRIEPSKVVLARVCALIARELRIDPILVVPHALLSDDLAADSLDVTDIVMSIEDLFEITVTDDRLEAARTVADIIAMVEQPSAAVVRQGA